MLYIAVLLQDTAENENETAATVPNSQPRVPDIPEKYISPGVSPLLASAIQTALPEGPAVAKRSSSSSYTGAVSDPSSSKKAKVHTQWYPVLSKLIRV